MKSSSRSVTQVLIARKAGVSQAAVSTILSGSGSANISEETRVRVLALAEELGYAVRKFAPRKLPYGAGRRSVLIVETEPPERMTNEDWIETAYQSFMGTIFSTTARCLQRHGITLSVFHLGDPRALTQWLAESDVEGVLWRGPDSDSTLLHWTASRFPLVLLNRQWQAAIAFDRVSIDQEMHIFAAAEHLWSLGHRRIAVFGHCSSNSFYRRRMAAYRSFTEERGLRNYAEFQEIPDALEIPAAVKVAAILDIWKRLGPQAPTALITSDVFALPLLREARGAGIRVPDDLSVIGIDNTAPCAFVEPALTSMEGSLEEMCRVGVDLLLRRKANPAEPSLSVQVAPRLVVRQSVRSLTETGTPTFSDLVRQT